MVVEDQGVVEEVPISLVVWQSCQEIPIYEPTVVVDLHREGRQGLQHSTLVGRKL